MRTRSNAYLRYTVLGVLVLIVYLLQVTPRVLPSIGGALPAPLLPLTVVIALREHEVAGAAFGLACGLLMDATSTSAMGFQAVLLLLLVFGCGLLASSLLNDTFRTALLLGAVSTALYCLSHWAVTCAFRGLAHAAGFLLYRYLPIFIYTMIFLIPFYFFVGWLERRMRAEN